MARKQAGSTNDKKAVTTTPVDATPAGATQAAPQASGQPRQRQQPPRALSIPVIIIFMVVPLIAMMWDAEAPARPFALTTVPSADGVTKKQLINPRILLVTAHPDDEILFAPTILSLLSDEKKKDATLWAVSLSTGDFGGGKELGDTRTVEWARSWNTLGLGRDKRIILDTANLKDNNATGWEPSAIAEHLAPIVQKNDIDTILTFDEKGVTHHPQHSSIPAGVKYLLTTKKTPSKGKKGVSQIRPRLYTLKTYPWSSQYGLLSPVVEHLSLGINTLLREYRAMQASQKGIKPDASDSQIEIPNTVFVASMKQYVKAWKALLQHKSQLSPSLFAIGLWGKYLWVNEWVEVPLDA